MIGAVSFADALVSWRGGAPVGVATSHRSVSPLSVRGAMSVVSGRGADCGNAAGVAGVVVAGDVDVVGVGEDVGFVEPGPLGISWKAAAATPSATTTAPAIRRRRRSGGRSGE